MTKEATCADRIGEEYASTMATLGNLWRWHQAGKDDDPHPEEETTIYAWGLSADYVEPETFNDQPHGYFRWQLSYGGPSDEFRFHGLQSTRYGFEPVRVEYRFHDWGDGAGVDVVGEDRDILLEVFEWLWPEPYAAMAGEGI